MGYNGKLDKRRGGGWDWPLILILLKVKMKYFIWFACVVSCNVKWSDFIIIKSKLSDSKVNARGKKTGVKVLDLR